MKDDKYYEDRYEDPLYERMTLAYLKYCGWKETADDHFSRGSSGNSKSGALSDQMEENGFNYFNAMTMAEPPDKTDVCRKCRGMGTEDILVENRPEDFKTTEEQHMAHLSEATHNRITVPCCKCGGYGRIVKL